MTAKYAHTDHEGSFTNMTSENVNVIVYGPGNITIDFGQENAAWFEIDSNDCSDNGLTESGETGNNVSSVQFDTKRPHHTFEVFQQ